MLKMLQRDRVMGVKEINHVLCKICHPEEDLMVSAILVGRRTNSVPNIGLSALNRLNPDVRSNGGGTQILIASYG